MQTMRRTSTFLDGPVCSAMIASLIWTALYVGASAQLSAQTQAQEAVEATASTAIAPVIPQQVRYAGKLANRAGDTVEAVFRIYAAAEGGDPLWTETQKITMGEDGSYTVLLGAASAAGLPQTVFAGGVARWVGVSVERAPELDRTMLTSVPYAMKAADAEALAGHAAADFVTRDQLAALAAVQTSATPAFQPEGGGTVTGSGTSGNVPLWTGALTQGNSEIVQVGSDIGINQATPGATLDVGGTENVEGTLALPPVAPATTSVGKTSQILQMSSSSWSTTVPGPVTQNFNWIAEPAGNDTATPSGSLLLQYQPAGSAATNILSIASNGVVTFPPAQTFAGTLNGITATSPLTAARTGGSYLMGINISALETLLDPLYPQVDVSNTFNGSQTIRGDLTVTDNLSGQNSTLTGTSSAVDGFLSNGLISITPTAVATTTYAVDSPLFKLGASAYSSTAAAASAKTYAWQTQVTGNNTPSPTTNLALLFGAGTAAPAATGLSFSSNGNINFSPTQVFPIKGTGGGTITGITTTGPLTGSGTAGSVALGLNQSTLVTDITPALETNFNSVYALLSGGNVFTSYLEAYQTAGPGNAALLGWGSIGSTGTVGNSDTGYGVQGASSSGQGVFGEVTSPGAGSEGVLGRTGSAFSSEYSTQSGTAYAGVWADSSGSGTGVPAALFATGDDTYGAVVVTNSSDFPTLVAINKGGGAGQFSSSSGDGVIAFASYGTGLYGSSSGAGNGVEGITSSGLEHENGVLGVAVSSSTISGLFDIYAGVQGDTGISSTAIAPGWAVGVMGTVDDGHAGVFINNSSGFSTLYVQNFGTGGTGESTGLFKTLMAKSADGTCGIGSGGSLSCTGQIKSLVSAGGGARTVETYSVQSPENWMEDFGSGELKSGVAVITIDAAFAETVTGDASYHVFLTPNGDSKGLYVISKTPTTFEVRESGGGTSSLTFDYRIVAKRRGYEAQRLVDVTERFNAEQKSAMPSRSSGVNRKPMTAAKSPLLATLDAHPRRAVPSRLPTPHRPEVSPSTATHP